jgi:4-amino-4-deoxy-L-arabinose transferase-like glycosyltransferase
VFSLVAIQSAIRRAARTLGERVRAEPVLFTATILVVLLGLVLRARGYLFERHGFWLDEALWAQMLMHDPLVTLLIRPIGFMGLNKAFALVFGPSETVLRAISWSAGTGAVLLAPGLARLLFRAPAARFLFIAVIALHPAAIDLAKEYKPYSGSFFAHLALLFLVLRYVETQRLRDLVWALAVAFVASLFAQDMVMAYPGVFLVLGWDTFKHRRERLIWVIVGAVAILALLAAQYWFIWRNLASDEADYWGTKYNIFYTPAAGESHFAWFVERYRDVAGFPGMRRRFWKLGFLSGTRVDALGTVDLSVWVILHVIGVLSLLLQRRVRLAVLLLVPFVIVSVLNTLGRWPFGLFRTNLFLTVYTAAIAGMALDLPGAVSRRWFAIVPGAVLVLLPLVLFDRDWNARKRYLAHDTDFAKVIKALVELEGPPRHGKKTPLILGRRVCPLYDYYATLHPNTSEKYQKVLERTFDTHCFKTNEALEQHLPKLVPPDGRAFIVTDPAGSNPNEFHEQFADKLVFRRRFDDPRNKIEQVTWRSRKSR